MPDVSLFSVFAIAIVVFALVLVFLGVKTVPQGFEFTVERFGRYTRKLTPGLHLIVPVVDRLRQILEATAGLDAEPGADRVVNSINSGISSR